MTSPSAPSTSTRRFAIVCELGAGLREEARTFSFRSPRAAQALRPVLSVVLAVTAAHAIGLEDSWWAAISAFVVMQEDFGASVYRGVLRIVGTLCGAGLGIVLGPAASGHAIAFVLLLGAAAWAGLFASLVLKHSYAWVLGLVTFVMVMCEAVAMRADLVAFAAARVATIMVGTLACVLVSGLTDPRVVAWLLRRKQRAAPPAQGSEPGVPLDRAGAALHSLHGAVAVALLSIAVYLQDLRSFPQAMVTTIAVLIVPLGGSEAEREGSVMQRMAQRLAGCLIAAAFAFALLPLIEQRAFWCQVVLGLGVWIGAYLQKGVASVRYMGVQFGVAFLMMFVQDRGWTVNAGPALQRLGGVFAGVASLSLVLAVSGLIRKTVALRRRAG